MSKIRKKIFSTTLSVAKKITRIPLCMLLVGLVFTMGCEKLKNVREGIEGLFGGTQDTIIILKMNEMVVVPNNNDPMTVSFVDVRDNRCPMSMCYLCYGSNAEISLSVTNLESVNVKIDLRIYGCILYPDSNNTGGIAVDTLGYRFKVFELSPYPDVGPINKNDFIAKIKITKL